MVITTFAAAMAHHRYFLPLLGLLTLTADPWATRAQAQTVQFSVVSLTVLESAGIQNIGLTWGSTPWPGGSITVDWALSPGTTEGAAPNDFTAVPAYAATLTITPR